MINQIPYDEDLPWATEAFGAVPDAVNLWCGVRVFFSVYRLARSSFLFYRARRRRRRRRIRVHARAPSARAHTFAAAVFFFPLPPYHVSSLYFSFFLVIRGDR